MRNRQLLGDDALLRPDQVADAGRRVPGWAACIFLQHLVRNADVKGEAWPGKKRHAAAVGCDHAAGVGGDRTCPDGR